MRVFLCLSAALILSFSLPAVAGQQPTALSTPDDVASDFKDVPCKTRERIEALRSLFMRMGANASDITTQKFRDAENVVVKLPGRTDNTIVLGAHYDFVSYGCGAIDNWTGIVAMIHAYGSIRSLDRQKTILFVAFDNEEKGLLGAKAMANAIPKDDVPRYCAMINIDSFGLAQPFALTNTSSASLVKLAADAASELQMPFSAAPIDNADADSSAFIARKIPALTLAGVSKDWTSILHSKKDQKERIDTLSVYAGYRLTFALWNRIDQAPCDAFRERTSR
jgi:Iap family predicted aminopeptidase